MAVFNGHAKLQVELQGTLQFSCLSSLPFIQNSHQLQACITVIVAYAGKEEAFSPFSIMANNSIIDFW